MKTPEIRYTLKISYGYVQEWEFESDWLEDLQRVIENFAKFASKPKMEDMKVIITPYIVNEEESANE